MQTIALAVFLVLCYGAGFLGQLATTPNIPTWYAALEKPSFNPPDAVFPIVWGILYAVMAIAAWLIWRSPPSRARTIALTLFAVQLFFNVAWSWIFFGVQNPPLGFVVIVVLVVAIAATVIAFGKVVREAALMLLPYLAWVVFATVLNAAIVALN
ncbi:MAG: tryptophan-rich sensory protein [Bauldia sp.]|nr:tryptophan-rich sensory protein [Bauldia sp.]